MRVRVKVHGHVREFLPGQAQEVTLDLSGPATVAQIIERLGVSPELFMYAFVDGQRRAREYRVERDAEVVLMSPAAGGAPPRG
ncbi:MAG: hypothetical protein K6T75_07250 [Acetobacteraceae bacterium]|nr:hypothetical protein [Acetobacteraceae bacterium]